MPPPSLSDSHASGHYPPALIIQRIDTRQTEKLLCIGSDEIIQTSQSETSLPCFIYSLPQKPHYRLLPTFPLAFSASWLTLVLLHVAPLHEVPCLLFLGNCRETSLFMAVISIFVCLTIFHLNKSWVSLKQEELNSFKFYVLKFLNVWDGTNY